MANRAGSRGCAVLIVLVGILTYANSLSGPMLFDDRSAIVGNPQIRHLWPLTESLAAPVDNELTSRPLVNFSFALNYAAGGLSVRGYHIVNVGVHVLSALLLFTVIRLTLSTPTLREHFVAAREPIALASALLWMVHPLQTEPVDYLTQRTELMMGLFYLLTLYCAIRAAGSARPQPWRAAAIFSCLVGMGCKESMATAPIVVVLYDRVFLFGSMSEAWRRRKGLYAGLALGWVALAALLTTSLPSTIGLGTRISSWSYLLNQFPMIVRYLWLTVWPHSLVLDYGLPRQLTLGQVLAPAAVVLALAVLTVIALVSRPALGFLGAWFFITLAPASSMVPIMTEVGAERRMYLPLAALAVLAAVAIHRLSALAGRRRGPVAAIATLLTVVALALATARRNHEYASPASVLQTSVDRWPQGRAHLTLAGVMLEDGRIDEAMTHMRAAVPDQPRALLMLGMTHYNAGRFDDAIRELRAFDARVAARPGWTSLRAIAFNLIALSFARQGELPQAATEFRAGLQLDAKDPNLHGNLALVLLQQHDFAGAREHFEAFLQRGQPNAYTLTNLGIALQGLGRRDEARARFRQALALDPNDREARRRLDDISAATAPPQK